MTIHRKVRLGRAIVRLYDQAYKFICNSAMRPHYVYVGEDDDSGSFARECSFHYKTPSDEQIDAAQNGETLLIFYVPSQVLLNQLEIHLYF